MNSWTQKFQSLKIGDRFVFVGEDGELGGLVWEKTGPYSASTQGGPAFQVSDDRVMWCPGEFIEDLPPLKPLTEEGSKDDQGKRRYDLVPASAERFLAEVMTFGAHKYDDLNWTKGIPFHKLYASARRHLNAFWEGEDMDEESGLPHLAHLMANAAMLLVMSLDEKYKEFDDREEYSL